MDLGAGVCVRAKPDCVHCPVHKGCRARIEDRVDELPARRRTSEKRVRRAHFLLVMDREGVLVEERPAHGIWGGLLAPPQYPLPRTMLAAARAFAATEPKALEARRHGFTHYTLDYTPHVLVLEDSERPEACAPLRWLAWSSLERAALPAPVRTLLRELRPL
jgi:A/G-specific adenine glycosylase